MFILNVFKWFVDEVEKVNLESRTKKKETIGNSKLKKPQKKSFVSRLQKEQALTFEGIAPFSVGKAPNRASRINRGSRYNGR